MTITLPLWTLLLGAPALLLAGWWLAERTALDNARGERRRKQ